MVKMNEQQKDAIALQNAEFDALTQLAKEWRRLQMTPVVDDDYPEVRHGYESVLQSFVDALTANRPGMLARALRCSPHAGVQPLPGLTFESLRAANIKRLPLFKNKHGVLAHSQPDGSDWSRSDWLEALVGELGEYANKSKKERRGDISMSEFLAESCSELPDILTYLDILAFRLGIDLAQVTRDKFNEVSRRVNADVFL
jgi:NTP pyrophosphatase (non-canonical NTP hydrolase)